MRPKASAKTGTKKPKTGSMLVNLPAKAVKGKDAAAVQGGGSVEGGHATSDLKPQ